MNSAALTCPECGQPLLDGHSACPACLLGLGVSDDQTAPVFASASSDHEGVLIGRYLLLGVIGEGGFGTVWMAQQEEPVRRRVALKILKAGMDTRQVVARFEAERQALAMMDHASIARVFDGGATEAGRPYFVMELVRGVPITEFCDARNMATRDRIALFIVVCQAIQHAHQKGVIHRDLKPSNILVTDQDGEPLPKVLDFGIAKATDTPLTEKTIFTRFHQIIGTPKYMSPEQAGLGGLDVDSRSDVYSLGVLLYELLTERTPFDGRELLSEGPPDALLRAVREAEPPKASARLSTLSREELLAVASRRGEPPDRLTRLVKGELDCIILKALEKDRNRRYETASALASDLNRFLQGEPVTAAPPSVGYQFSKFAKKHRHVLATLFAFVLILIAGIVATTTQAVKATRIAKSEAAQRAIVNRLRADQRELLYASQMAVCASAIDFGQVQKARQILEDQRPNFRMPDLRGWEWRHLWALSRPMELDVLGAQPGVVSALAYSPDGSRLALAYGGHARIRIYDTKDKSVLADKQLESGIVDTLAFTPDGDGLYVSLRSTNFLLLDSATLSLQHSFAGHQQPVSAVVPDTKGDIIVSAAGNLFGEEGDAETFIWDARERKVLFKLPGGVGTAILPRISRSGHLSRGMKQGMVEVWDLRERRKLVEFKAHQNITYATAFSPVDETMLATTGDNGFVRLWNWRERQEIATLGRHTAPGSDIVFSPDGSRVATSSLDSTVRIWDVADQREQSVLLGHRGGIHRVVFSPDGSRIASAGGPDYSVRFWSAESRGPSASATLLDVATQSSATGQFTPDGKIYCLLRVTPDGSSLKMWRTEPSPDGSYELINSFRSPEALAMTLSGTNLVLLAAGQSEIVVHELTSRKELQWMKSPVPLLGPISASRDGRWLAAFAMSNNVVVWDAENGTPAAVFQRLDAAPAPQPGSGALLFSADGTKLWVVFPGVADVACVDWRATNCVVRLEGHERTVLTLASSPDGTIIATGSADMTTRLWDAATGANIAVLHGENGGVTALSFSPDGLTLAAGYFDGPIKLWSVRAKTELTPFYAHNSIVHSVLFSPEPDGASLASASYDGTARLWRAPSRGKIDSVTHPTF